jgi:hypothetical protein
VRGRRGARRRDRRRRRRCPRWRVRHRRDGRCVRQGPQCRDARVTAITRLRRAGRFGSAAGLGVASRVVRREPRERDGEQGRRRPERAQRGDLAPPGQGPDAPRPSTHARPAFGPHGGLGPRRLLFVPESGSPVPECVVHPNPPVADNPQATSIERNAERPAPAISGCGSAPPGLRGQERFGRTGRSRRNGTPTA